MNSFDPTPAEIRALHLAEAQLTNTGIQPGPKGYDLNTLALAIYDLGGTYSIDQSSGSYVAGIHPQRPLELELRGEGVGWTPESALVFALIQAITPRSEPMSRE